ncbi:DNL zinc finger-domain-containing protein [Amylostereum chailletii]|nr:DNL zinc finger-domain-containing protein [Amylostereum chailletii]
MLPSRLFRNTGIAPRLRSLVTPSSSLPASISVQLRFRLGVLRHHSSDASPSIGAPSNSSATSSSGTTTTQKIQIQPEEPKLSLTFTCTVPNCGTRSTHQFTKRAYERGIVLVECPGCKNRHLIADHLGWFKESTEDGKLKTVEDLLRAKGETIRRGRVDAGGDVEYIPDES